MDLLICSFIEAKTKVVALEIEVLFLKEKQVLKMAAEQLALRQSLTQAREEERIYEEMKNEESTLAPVHTQILPICTMQSGNFAGLEPTLQQKPVNSLGITDYGNPLQANHLSSFTFFPLINRNLHYLQHLHFLWHLQQLHYVLLTLLTIHITILAILTTCMIQLHNKGKSTKYTIIKNRNVYLQY